MIPTGKYKQPTWIKGYTFSPNFRVIDQPEYHDIKDWHKDDGCFVIIKIEDGNIKVGVCDYKMQVLEEVVAVRPQQIYNYLCNQTKFITRLDHAAYLGKELARAELCIKNGEEYVQE